MLQMYPLLRLRQTIDYAEVMDRFKHCGSEKIPRAGHAAAEDDHWKIERIDEVGNSDSEIEAHALKDQRRTTISLLGELSDLDGHKPFRPMNHLPQCRASLFRFGDATREPDDPIR